MRKMDVVNLLLLVGHLLILTNVLHKTDHVVVVRLIAIPPMALTLQQSVTAQKRKWKNAVVKSSDLLSVLHKTEHVAVIRLIAIPSLQLVTAQKRKR